MFVTAARYIARCERRLVSVKHESPPEVDDIREKIQGTTEKAEKERDMEPVIVIEPGEQGGYVVDFPLFPGCCSHGDSIEEALNDISEAIAGCLKSRLARAVRENR
jgi:predicted RNase H-like HicB family nuclease